MASLKSPPRFSPAIRWIALCAAGLGACQGSGLSGRFVPPDAGPEASPPADVFVEGEVAPDAPREIEVAPDLDLATPDAAPETAELGPPESAEPSPEVGDVGDSASGEGGAEVSGDLPSDAPEADPCVTDADCQHLVATCRWATCTGPGGTCESDWESQGTPCDDAQACTTGETCQQGGACVGTAAGDGTGCDDQNPCSAGDHCSAGLCIGKKATSCDDQNACTDDLCLPGTGCTHKANLASCDDGKPCSIADYCQAGACLGGTPKCDDGNPCTAELCHEASGTCTYVPSNALVCSDGSECTSGDKCVAGACIPGAANGCEDGNGCTADACTGGKTCTHAALGGSACSDGDACTTADTCAGTKCSGGPKQKCDDAQPCTADACDPTQGCVYSPLAGSPCSDGSACTEGDLCDAAGACVPGAAKGCADANPCTDEGCDPMTGCWVLANTAPCDDGTECTEADSCTGAKCVGQAVSCDDASACTEDACDPLLGCEHLDVAGLCQDGDPCTDDECAPGEGCLYTANQAACDDASPCTVDDTCAQGSCQGSSLCDDGKPCTLDLCDPEELCVNVPFQGPCEDGDLCTGGESCGADGTCVGGAALPLEDGVACTVDACTPEGGVTHALDHGACGEGFLCGAMTGCVLAPGVKLVITKLLLFPDAVTVDGQGQWIQVQNVGAVAVDLTRFAVLGASGSVPIRAPGGVPDEPVLLGPGDRAAGAKAPPVLPDPALAGHAFVFGAEGEPFFLISGTAGAPGIGVAGTGIALDGVPLVAGSTQDVGSADFPVMSGVATELDAARIGASDPTLANDDPKVWCVDPHGGSGPGEANLACTAAWLNEVSLAGEPAARWVELYLYAGGSMAGLEVRIFDADGEPLVALAPGSGRFPFGKTVALMDGTGGVALPQLVSGAVQLVRGIKLSDVYGFGALQAAVDTEHGLALLEGTAGPAALAGKAALRPVDGEDSDDNAVDWVQLDGGSPGALNAP